MANLTLFDLAGKKALVTGGAVGIGRGCAVALARAGADVAIVDLNEQAGTQTAEEIRSMGVQSSFVPCDVTQKEQVQDMVRQVVGSFGRLLGSEDERVRPPQDLVTRSPIAEAGVDVRTRRWLRGRHGAGYRGREVQLLAEGGPDPV